MSLAIEPERVDQEDPWSKRSVFRTSRTSAIGRPSSRSLKKEYRERARTHRRRRFHLQLGRVLEKKFLAGVKALKHFQDAYKLNPALLEALGEARAIYWELGKLNMVQKLLELELKAVQGSEASKLLVELGDVLSDLGDNDKATATYARALAASGGENKEASACLEDVQAESGSWEQQVAQLLRSSNDASPRQKGGFSFARLASRAGSRPTKRKHALARLRRRPDGARNRSALRRHARGSRRSLAARKRATVFSRGRRSRRARDTLRSRSARAGSRVTATRTSARASSKKR